MSGRFEEFKKAVASWTGVSVHPHRFGGREFRFGNAEIGHVHAFGDVDIPFTRAIRDALLSAGLAEKHRWVPNSGWVTFSLRSEKQLPHALWLMRLSYLRYALKQAANPEQVLEEETGKLLLSSQFASLLRQHVPRASSA
ncbi:MAG: DUF5519 family protein [Acidobacteria bacterium]|nr:DUF5519 family protein [Acidobacteriota bacterium]MBV8890770.1 DUF5519 family protein [Acidobacteriota bacterium]MBV9483132.1 DUF5519 family protein [Acidobacteriota bacterium]